MARSFAWLHVGAPLLMALMFLPLALAMVGPNPIYGYRTAASLSSPEAWRQANVLAGWIGFAFSIAALLINLYLLKADPQERGPVKPWAVFAVALAASAVMMFAVNG